MNLFEKIKRKWMKLRLQPIRVLCFHHVTEEYDASYMKPCDWRQLSTFQLDIQRMQREGVRFISLDAAYNHIKNDYLRTRKYVAITFDDGCKSQKGIIPWLMEQQIPVTLFINGKYLDGKSYRDNPLEQYLTADELLEMVDKYGILLSVQSHGWEHTDAAKMTAKELKANITKTLDALTPYTIHSLPVKYHAYTWGSYTKENDEVLHSMGIVPVKINGRVNYNDSSCIDRG